ncbi:response regulator [Streptomyces mangrovisoli]|uniref:Response regulator n=1 Tax=Streptomyces mangrovisoli TaxID=1428628 RepID=A0A1J4P4F7_9ACTN|nr:response regulator [Streptomyces mangrovisoli]OIJ69082.1 response regulator [Streptomyces mangrovisoli]
MPADDQILIVDDHQDTLYALESALSPLGYRLGRATSGDEALKQVLRGRVGLLLLDVRLPGADGLDVVRYLRRLEQTQHIPVVLLTGFGADHDLISAAFALGVADLLPKPVDPWALRTKIRYLYDAHQHRLALEAELRALRELVAKGGADGCGDAIRELVEDGPARVQPHRHPALTPPDAGVPPPRQVTRAAPARERT